VVSRRRDRQVIVSRLAAALGLGLYNWWVWAVRPGRWLSSADEFFSDLEATGETHSAALRHADVLAGALVLVALALGGGFAGSSRRPEWALLVTFASASVLGGLFPYVCAEGAAASCRAAEWQLRLGWRHYVHIGAGILEFAAVTAAIVLAARRTAGKASGAGRTYRALLTTLLLGYPLLAVAYLADRLGALVEPVFFLCFSVAVLTELLEAEDAAD
jgi:hypothetical protein